MATVTSPTARSCLAQIAAMFTDLPAVKGYRLARFTKEERSQHIAIVARIIRAADDLLAELAAAPPGEVDGLEELTTTLTGLRHAALMLMGAYNPSQAWYWTPEWQKGEREAEADRAAG